MKTIATGLAFCCILLLSIVTDIECRRHRDRDADRAEERATRAEERAVRAERREQRLQALSRDKQAAVLLDFFNELRKAGLINEEAAIAPQNSTTPDVELIPINTINDTDSTEADNSSSVTPATSTTPKPKPVQDNLGPRVVENYLNHKPLLSEASASATEPQQQQQRPIKPLAAYQPIDVENVNQGVSTILNGVSSLRLSEILRGSFMFTRNDNVKSVANSVIDTIFGKRDNDSLPADSEPGVRAGLFPLKGL